MTRDYTRGMLQRWKDDLLLDVAEMHEVLDWLDGEIASLTPDYLLRAEPPPAPPVEPPAPPEPEIRSPETESEAVVEEGPGPDTPPSEAPAETRGYVRADWPMIRAALQHFHPGAPTTSQLAERIGCSSGQLGYKLPKMFDEGLVIKITKRGAARWQLAKPNAETIDKLKPSPRSKPKLTIVASGVPLTGKQNPKVLKRKHVYKGVKGT